MRQEILRDFKEHGFSYRTLHDYYAKLLESLKDGNDFGQYHDVQTKLTGLHNMYKNGELPEPKSLTSDLSEKGPKEPVVVPLNAKVPTSLVPVPSNNKVKDTINDQQLHNQTANENVKPEENKDDPWAEFRK